MLGISSSFHDLSMWSAYCDEKGHVEKEGESDGEREREDGEGDRGERGPPWLAGVRTHSKSMRLVQVLAPTFVHPSGGALSLAGVAAATGLGVTVCHSVRLLLREVLEALPRMFATEPLLGAISDAAALRRARTFELYLLSLLHHGAWVGMALRRCLSRQGWHHDAGGSTRALVLSAGYHLYILLAIDSIWTHPLVTLQQIGTHSVADSRASVDRRWEGDRAGSVALYGTRADALRPWRSPGAHCMHTRAPRRRPRRERELCKLAPPPPPPPPPPHHPTPPTHTHIHT